MSPHNYRNILGHTKPQTPVKKTHKKENPTSYEIGFLISFNVKIKQDRKSYLVQDRMFNLIWSPIEM